MTITVEPTMITHENFSEVLTEVDTFIFDADGVLWLGEDAIPGSPELVDYLLSLVSTFLVLK